MMKKYDISLLYVEDDIYSSEEMIVFLKMIVRELHFAKNGKEGLSLYKEHSPDLILTDINMPVMDGITMSSEIKKIDSNAKIIILSAYSDTTYFTSAIDIGVESFIIKPINFEKLISNFDKVIKNQKLEKENAHLMNLVNEYKTTFDLSSTVTKTDINGNITYINKKFEEVSGYTSAELLGKNHRILKHPDNSTEVYKDLWNTIKNKEPWFGKIRNKRKDGSAFYLDTVIKPILDEKGEILEFVAVRHDITELEERKLNLKNKYKIKSEKFQDVMHLTRMYEDAINESTIIIRINYDLKINYVNEHFCRLSGYGKDELIGESYLNIMNHSESEEKNIRKVLRYVNKYGIWKGQLKSKNKFEKDIHYVSTILPIRDRQENILEYIIIRKDITEIIELKNELELTQSEIIYKMGEIGETRSKETGNHVKRVAKYSELLALKIGLTKEEAQVLRLASPMHDIGKVGIEDSILLKPGKLTDEEFEIMKSHAQMGYELLKNSNRRLLQSSAIVAYEHHEKWDGSGYPRGLKGSQIHIYGRITAICDVFDALSHDRPYKKAWDMEKVVEFFKAQRGKHFDPHLLDVFLKDIKEFIEIMNKYMD